MTYNPEDRKEIATIQKMVDGINEMRSTYDEADVLIHVTKILDTAYRGLLIQTVVSCLWKLEQDEKRVRNDS